MRWALVDNSTLTAVQRLLGDITINNKYSIDGDILAFESFIQTVLFYDDVFFVDDYKSQYKYKRKELFKYIYPVELDNDDYSSLIRKTQELTNEFIPEINNRKFQNDNLKEFFDLLRMNITFTWDLSSSVYYLNYKLLQEHSGVDIDKYSKLSAMIFDQLMDKNIEKEVNSNINPIIYDSRGNAISKNYTVTNKEGRECETGGLSRQAYSFLSGLSWLDFRTTFYMILANQLKFDLVLHPIRNAYAINTLNRFTDYNSPCINTILKAMNNQATDSINRILNCTQPIVLKHNLPMFSVWIAQKYNGIEDFMDILYTLKGEKEFVRARDILDNLNLLQQEGKQGEYVTKANLLYDDFTKQLRNIEDKYGINPSTFSPVSSLIWVNNVTSGITGIPQLPKISPKFKVPKGIKQLKSYSGFGATYKSIISDLVQIEKLGKWHEIITANIKIANNADFYEIKTEDIKYKNLKSGFKIPL